MLYNYQVTLFYNNPILKLLHKIPGSGFKFKPNIYSLAGIQICAFIDKTLYQREYLPTRFTTFKGQKLLR
ncbi:hypothetical protein DVR12_22320 [Chitinophaga silvatica]|uniref:Uncharacterized protein n=1 Tax=Chitinophaga silvatica TaxID=2282649 RepID=A0A3E1Y572_9BACT|nr:hypothetical protein DVR12_22320 [Chitinophaga silvatica]